MATVQEKLQECINSGQMNSFERLSRAFAGEDAATRGGGDGGGDDVAMADAAVAGKDAAKVPAKKAKASKHQQPVGMYGDKTSKKVGEKRFRRGRNTGRSSVEGRRRSSSKKRSGKKLATI